MHHVSLKPVILGSIASYLAKVPYIVNALTGLGTIFVSESLHIKLIKILVFEPVLGIIFKRKNTYTIVQNIDDKKRLLSLGIIRKDRTFLIKGSGVDITYFNSQPEINDKPIVLFASRMIKDKGVEIFVTAAKKLKEEKINARFVLVGDIDTGNPYSITKDELLEWDNMGIVEWWGYREDMREVFSVSHIVCLPSLYGEGLPKVLLEAAASGKPIIASDIPGCREIVRDGENGILVQVKNVSELSKAITRLLKDKSLREKMGDNGRHIVEKEFTKEIVNRETLEIYKKIEASSN